MYDHVFEYLKKNINIFFNLNYGSIFCNIFNSEKKDAFLTRRLLFLSEIKRCMNKKTSSQKASFLTARSKVNVSSSCQFICLHLKKVLRYLVLNLYT